MAALAKQGSDVRVTEVDLSASIVTAGNITAAMVDVSAYGPIGPTIYTSFDQYKKDFGTPNSRVSFGGFCAFDFFKEGNQMYVSRAIAADARWGIGFVLSAVANGVTSVSTGQLVDPANIIWPNTSAVNVPLFAVYGAKGPGSYSGQISLKIRSDNLDAPTGTTAAALLPTAGSTTGGLTPSTYSYRVAAVQVNGSETLASAQASVTIASAAGTFGVNVSWDEVSGAIGYHVYGRSASGTMGRIATVGGATFTYLDTGYITPVVATPPILLAANLAAAASTFTLDVYNDAVNPSVPAESFECSLDEALDEQGLQTEITSRVNAFSELIRVESYVTALATTPIVRSMAKTALGTGTAGSTPTTADVINAWTPFYNKEMYQIDVLVNAGRTSVSVQKAMDTLAQKRFDCVAFLDMPSTTQKAQAAVDYRRLSLNLNSSFSALFCSDLLENDPNTGKTLYVPPSGAMAALLARTTRISQPWFSMAGLNRGLLDVLGVRNTYTEGEMTLLYQSQVNYMRKFIGQGIPLWEQSTLAAKNSALSFLNVRVLCNVIKRSMYAYLLYALQDPNDDILRKQIKFGLEEFLSYVQAARGISKASVIINSTNNPPALVNSGTLAVSVYIVPILAVRQINLTLLIGKEGLQVTEQDLAVLSL